MRIHNVVIDANDIEALSPFWEAATGYKRVWSNEYFIVLAADEPGLPSLLLQRVAEPKVGKNRCHVDLQAEGDVETEIQRLVDLGATRGASYEQGISWTVMADPAGNEFCISHPNPQNT
jgi:hypothetical protein